MLTVHRIAFTSFGITFLIFGISLLSAQPAQAQDNKPFDFSQEVSERTVTLQTLNPYTKAPGSLTITYSATFTGKRLTEASMVGISEITGKQKGKFAFAPDDPSQPVIEGNLNLLLGGKTQPGTDMIEFAFTIEGKTNDGARVTFVLTERAVINEAGIDLTFQKLKRLVLMDDIKSGRESGVDTDP